MLFDSVFMKSWKRQSYSTESRSLFLECEDMCVCVLSPSLLLATPGDCSPPASSVHGIFSGKNTGVGCHFLLSGIFLTQGSKPRPWISRKILYCWATEEGFWLQTGTRGLFGEMHLFNIMIMEACKRNEYSCQNIELYI